MIQRWAIMKKLITFALALAASCFACVGQSLVSMPVVQNPLFGVSTNEVNATFPEDSPSVILGSDLVITGGSGTYSYRWYDNSGQDLGYESTLQVSAPGKYLLDVKDTCDCLQTVNFNISVSGVDDIRASKAKISFDSMCGQVDIEGFDPVQLSAVDMSGRLSAVIDHGGVVFHTADLSSLTGGVYIITLTDSRGSVTSLKLIK